MTTPEGDVKEDIKKLLYSYNIINASKAAKFPKEAVGWYYMPAQQGMGVRGIPDFLGNFHGIFWAIEAKAEGKTPTGFQQHQIDALKKVNAAVFVIDGFDSLKVFNDWLINIIMGDYYVGNS